MWVLVSVGSESCSNVQAFFAPFRSSVVPPNSAKAENATYMARSKFELAFLYTKCEYALHMYMCVCPLAQTCRRALLGSGWADRPRRFSDSQYSVAAVKRDRCLAAGCSHSPSERVFTSTFILVAEHLNGAKTVVGNKRRRARWASRRYSSRRTNCT